MRRVVFSLALLGVTACGLSVLGVATPDIVSVDEAGVDASPVVASDAAGDPTDAFIEAPSNDGEEPRDAGPTDATCPATGPCERLMFITAAKFTGDLGGLAGGDRICQQTANDAGLVRLHGRAFAAWLGTSTTSVNRLDKRGSFIMPNDAALAKDWPDLLDGTIPVFFNKDESGGTVDISDDDVWSGVYSDGGSTPTSCLDWTTADAGQNGGVGLAARTNAEWSNARTGGCQVPCHLFCIEK